MTAWNDVARAWDEHYDFYARGVRPLSEWFLETVARPGARVLDVASGTGQPALAIAARAAHVTASDISRPMIDALERRARREGFNNVDAFEMSAEELRFDAATFDAVTCACGIMFCDATLALGEMRRVLKPGGTLALAVWDAPSNNPFFTLAASALSTVIPPAPGPQAAFRFGALDELSQLIERAGFVDVRVARRALVFEVSSADEYWDIFTRLAAGVAQRLAAVSEADRARARDVLRSATEQFRDGDRLRLPASALAARANSST